MRLVLERENGVSYASKPMRLEISVGGLEELGGRHQRRDLEADNPEMHAFYFKRPKSGNPPAQDDLALNLGVLSYHSEVSHEPSLTIPWYSNMCFLRWPTGYAIT